MNSPTAKQRVFVRLGMTVRHVHVSTSINVLLFIEHLSIECRKTKTEVITAADQNELKCF